MLRVRAGREADAAAVDDLVRAAFAAFTADTGVVPEPIGTDWATTASARGLVVALIEDRIVGVLVLWPHPDHVLVETLAVAPEAQGAGVGSALLGVAERRAVETGAGSVRLATNARMAARAWYSRRGYRETGRGTERGFDRVFLERLLC